MIREDLDGYIDNVYVFYAGLGEASGGERYTVWPHVKVELSGRVLIEVFVDAACGSVSVKAGARTGSHLRHRERHAQPSVRQRGPNHPH